MRSRALLLPGLALLLIALTYGPELWARFYQPIKEYCEMHLASVSGLAVVSSIMAIVGLIAIAGGSIRVLMHMRSDGVLKRRLRQRTVPAPDVLTRAASRANVRSPIVCVDEAAPYAFCRGLASPKIYVSTGLIDLLDEEDPTEERIRRLTGKVGERTHHRSGLRTLSAPVVWSAASSLVAVAVVAVSVQVISSIPRCTTGVA